MGEGRIKEYGRNLAILINYVVDTIPKNQRKEYKKSFLEELEKYSFKPRPKGTPRNEGCVWELEDLDNVEIKTQNILRD
jgi:hypothetical protein